MEKDGKATARKTFQFHKGTIKPDFELSWTDGPTVFQFHKGTIKPIKLVSLHRLILHFNSIKVRLNHLYTPFK